MMSQQARVIKQNIIISVTASDGCRCIIVYKRGNIPHAEELSRLPGNDATSAASGDKRTVPQLLVLPLITL
jgi:hypothetical protein